MNERHCIITNYACGAKYAKQRMCGMRSMRSIGGRGGVLLCLIFFTLDYDD